MNNLAKLTLSYLLLSALSSMQAVAPLASFVRSLLDEYQVTYPAYYAQYPAAPTNANSCARADIGLEFVPLLEEFIATQSTRITNSDDWVGGINKLGTINPRLVTLCDMVDLDSSESITHTDTVLWAQKKIVNSFSHVFFVGDLHGDTESLMLFMLDLQRRGFLLDDYTLVPNCYVIFTGDYIDRGPYSLDTLAWPMSLVIKNPENVIMLRGNHEEHTKIIPDSHMRAIINTITSDPKEQKHFMLLLNKAYNAMPAVLFFGIENTQTHHIDYIMAAHAGLELAYLPDKLLGNATAKYEFLPDNIEQMRVSNANIILNRTSTFIKPTQFADAGIGLLWSDFFENADAYRMHEFGIPELRLQVGKPVVDAYFAAACKDVNATMHLLVRGHQHAAQTDCTPDQKVFTITPCFSMLHDLSAALQRQPTAYQQASRNTHYLHIETRTGISPWRIQAIELEHHFALHTITVHTTTCALPFSLSTATPVATPITHETFDIPVAPVASSIVTPEPVTLHHTGRSTQMPKTQKQHIAHKRSVISQKRAAQASIKRKQTPLPPASI